MKQLALASLVLLFGCAGDPDARFVVHEWGTWTSVSGSDGVPIDWRPLSAADDLPTFVYRQPGVRGFPSAQLTKNLAPTRVRMETPVIYFYSDRERSVSTAVRFPKGRITEWYPAVKTAASGIDWGRFTVLPPHVHGALPREAADSHYYPARETEASLVHVRVAAPAEDQREKFLFYRGVGTFDLPIRATLDGNRVTVEKLDGDPLPQAILFENSGGKVGIRVLGPVRERVTAERPNLIGNVDTVEGLLIRTLTGAGLFEKEAVAMLRTWRDSWFEEGLRLFYLVPRPATDAVLPLAIDPKPDSLVRVLVGRAELITPEQEARMMRIVRALASESAVVRDSARADFTAWGRFADPTLRRLLRSATDPALKARLLDLIPL